MIKTHKEVMKENFKKDCKELGIELQGKTRLQALYEFEQAMVNEFGNTGLIKRIVDNYKEWL